MRGRRVTCAKALALGGMALLLSPPAASPQASGGGSTVPCAVPLRWRVSRVDRDFDISARRVTRIVAEAADWWSGGADAQLFEHDPDDGFPIRLVFDERQAALREHLRGVSSLEAGAAELDAERLGLLAREEAWRARQAAYEERARSYERLISAHNDEVRRWNARGGAPPEVAEELAARESELDAERRGLDRAARDLESELEGLQSDQRAFNERAANQDRRGRELQRSNPVKAVQAGEYRERVEREGGRVASVGREIRIYRFADEADLRLVVAHELGHALGLGHSDDPTTVMAEQHERTDDGGVPREAAGEDLRRLRRLCPELAESLHARLYPGPSERRMEAGYMRSPPKVTR